MLFTLGGQKYPLSLLIGEFGRPGRMAGEVAYKFMDAKLAEVEKKTVLEYEKQQLEKNNADFGRKPLPTLRA